ncbi:MAG: transcriptional repressor [Anaerolineae bacterium]|nr:transcriptional repressor [Anaerolineae bacterium]
MDPETRFNELIQRLRQRQCRLTPQRIALIRVLTSSEDHPTAAQLYDRLRAQFPTMSLGTVYKTLDLLFEMGEVLEISVSDGAAHYDGRKPFPHPHLICIRCRKIRDAESSLAENMTLEITQTSGFRIVGHRLDFYGLCPDCRQAE